MLKHPLESPYWLLPLELLVPTWEIESLLLQPGQHSSTPDPAVDGIE